MVPRARFELATSGISNRRVYQLRHLGDWSRRYDSNVHFTPSEGVSSASWDTAGKSYRLRLYKRLDDEEGLNSRIFGTAIRLTMITSPEFSRPPLNGPLVPGTSVRNAGKLGGGSLTLIAPRYYNYGSKARFQ